MNTSLDPRDYPINAGTRERWERFRYDHPPVPGITDTPDAQEVRWCWEEIAQLNAGIKWLENLLDAKSIALGQWKDEARDATHTLKTLRALVPPL